MEPDNALFTTRRALHGVAELVLAGPQHTEADTVRLRVVDGGFATTAGVDVSVAGTTLHCGDVQIAVEGGTPRGLASALGLEAKRLDGVYSDSTDVGLDEVLHVDDRAAAALIRAWSAGDAALRRLDPGQVPVLWPEHFDVGITIGEVNYGVSPSDSAVAIPYAYVGPWTMPPADDFWTESFGAVRLISDSTGADEVLAFFEEGRRRLSG